VRDWDNLNVKFVTGGVNFNSQAICSFTDPIENGKHRIYIRIYILYVWKIIAKYLLSQK
jgi:hypothetical protein